VALLWALHPLRVESVAWVSSRKDVLSGVFFFLALIAWDGWVRGRGPRPLRSALALCAAGLTAKPVLMTFPLVLLILDGWPYARLSVTALKPLVAEKVPFFLLSSVSALFTMAANRAGWAGEMVDAPAAGARFAGALISCARLPEGGGLARSSRPVHPFDGKPRVGGVRDCRGGDCRHDGPRERILAEAGWFAAGGAGTRDPGARFGHRPVRPRRAARTASPISRSSV